MGSEVEEEIVDSGGRRRAERRTGVDRRHQAGGLPKGRERRVHLEPRKPEVKELLDADSVWDQYFSRSEDPSPD